MGWLENCFLGIFSASLRMSIIIIIFLLVKNFFISRYTAKSRYYLWLLVIIGLLMPINLSDSHSILNVPIEHRVINTENISNDIQDGNLNGKVTIEKVTDSSSKNEKNNKISALEVAAVIWIIGAIIYLLINIIKHLIFINSIKRWVYENNDELLIQYLEKTKTELNIKADIQLKSCKIIQTPMLIGFLHPKILMPLNPFSEDEFYFIFKHELTHFKRKDLLYKLIILFANGVHWFNPIIYLMSKEIAYECEVSCDEAIMESEPINRRRLYGEMILNTMLENAKKKSALSTSFFGGKKEMKRRLKSIIDTKMKKKARVVFFVLILIVLGVTLILNINVKNESSVLAKEIVEENNTGENSKAIYENTLPTEMPKSYPIQKAMSNKDVIIITDNKTADGDKVPIKAHIINFDSIKIFKEKIDKGERAVLRLVKYIQPNESRELHENQMQTIEFTGKEFYYSKYNLKDNTAYKTNNNQYADDMIFEIYDKFNVIENGKGINLTFTEEKNGFTINIASFNKDNIEVSVENNLINSDNGKIESDFIKTIEDATSDEGFVIQMDDIPDSSFIFQK
ncbi:M56 family metallopeptidase [Clostridium sp. C2-6-12]|uniref:M56 family metallopeptidase n=1 Tax=Clostridium sp. C2-6-12 TaxID=2698832 RepID=UPI00136A1B73|nr:M56 family metallopeptidase [Clostridium sp. C2-6-12]